MTLSYTVRGNEPEGTRLLYLEDQHVLVAGATIVDCWYQSDDFVIVTDLTPMYPRRGGQPSDVGILEGAKFRLDVREVVLGSLAQVLHIGTLYGAKPDQGDEVRASVNSAERRLHSLWHTAGEAVIVAAKMAGFDEPVVGAIHYGPNQNRIEYLKRPGSSGVDTLSAELTPNLARIVADNTAIECLTSTNRDLILRICGFWPDYVPIGEPIRMVRIRQDVTGRPCTGTHFDRTSELGEVKIDRIRAKGNKLIVSYSCILQ